VTLDVIRDAAVSLWRFISYWLHVIMRTCLSWRFMSYWLGV